MFRVPALVIVQLDLRLLFFAGLIAASAALVSLHTLGHGRDCHGRARGAWLALAGATAAAGFWATHFLAIRAYEWGAPTAYNPGLVALALLAGTILITAGFALALPEGRWQAAAGGAVVGLGMVVGHAVGMKALDLPGVLHANRLVAVPVNVMTVALCCAALIAYRELRASPGAVGRVRPAHPGRLRLALRGGRDDRRHTRSGHCRFRVGHQRSHVRHCRGMHHGAHHGHRQGRNAACGPGFARGRTRPAAPARPAGAAGGRAEPAKSALRHGADKPAAGAVDGGCRTAPRRLQQAVCGYVRHSARADEAGTPISALVEHRIASGIYSSHDAQALRAESLGPVTKPTVKTRYLNGGRVVLVSRRPTPDGGWIAVHEDITERRRLQETEREAKEALAAVFDAVPAAIVCVATDRRVMLWSRGAEHIFGYTAQETVGQPYKLVPPDGKEQFDTLFERAIGRRNATRPARAAPAQGRISGGHQLLLCRHAPDRDRRGGSRHRLRARDLTEREKLAAASRRRTNSSNSARKSSRRRTSSSTRPWPI